MKRERERERERRQREGGENRDRALLKEKKGNFATFLAIICVYACMHCEHQAGYYTMLYLMYHRCVAERDDSPDRTNNALEIPNQNE